MMVKDIDRDAQAYKKNACSELPGRNEYFFVVTAHLKNARQIEMRDRQKAREIDREIDRQIERKIDR